MGTLLHRELPTHHWTLLPWAGLAEPPLTCGFSSLMTSRTRTWLSRVTSHLHKHSEFLSRISFILLTLSAAYYDGRFSHRKLLSPCVDASIPVTYISQEKTGLEVRAPPWLSERTRTRWVYSATHDTPPSHAFLFQCPRLVCLMDLFFIFVNICAYVLIYIICTFPIALIYNSGIKLVWIYHILRLKILRKRSYVASFPTPLERLAAILTLVLLYSLRRVLITKQLVQTIMPQTKGKENFIRHSSQLIKGDFSLSLLDMFYFYNS